MYTGNNIFHVCRFIQRMDRNSDSIQMFNEYKQGLVCKDTIIQALTNVLTDWLENGLTESDVREKAEINRYLDLLNEIRS